MLNLKMNIKGKLAKDYKLIQNLPKTPKEEHTGYPETNNATDNTNAVEVDRREYGLYMSGNNLPRIKLIRGKLLPDKYLLPMTDY